MRSIQTNDAPLIPQDAIDEMNRQDAIREKRRAEATPARFRARFADSIRHELELVLRDGACADLDPETGEIIPGRRIADKYPTYRPGRFMRWLMSFKDRHGVSIIRYNPVSYGLLVNEGGRGMTFQTSKLVPFRLYVAGWVLAYYQKKLTFRHTRRS